MSVQPARNGLTLGQGVLAVVAVVAAGIGMSKFMGSSSSSEPPRPEPVAATSEASNYRAPDEGSAGTIDCHGEHNTSPLLPTLQNFDEWTKSGSTQQDLIFKFKGKILDKGDLATALEDTGQTWIKIRLTTGKFVGSEGYVFRTCINK